MKRILGIDPGLRHTGWGVIEAEGNAVRFVACGTISVSPSGTLPERVATLAEAMKEVVLTYNPHTAAIEETFVNKNPMSSLKLGHARGALMVSVSQAGVPLAEYAARLVKKTVTGVGKADKQQVEAMVKVLLPKAEVDSADAADALAVAICHASHATRILVEEALV